MAIGQNAIDALVTRLNTTAFGRVENVTDITIRVAGGEFWELKQVNEVWLIQVHTPEPTLP